MTPQEKAVELLTKYRRHLPVNTVTDLEVKGCALIAVDEILKEKEDCHKFECYGSSLEYWQEVKAEIEKL